jgi:predicted acyl esterase
VASWDGVPLDVTLVLPSERAAAAGPLPLVTSINGLGNSKYEYLDPASEAYTGNAWGWAKRGYAALTYTARGFWGSCGTPDARAASPAACAKGYIHLADVRYEARDAQHLIGLLVDERLADPQRIGVTGDSYGGGQTTMIAALRDRIMLPDGKLAAWTSPGGTPLRVAAAAPVIPWTDLVYAIAPNGRTLHDEATPAGAETAPVGIFKITVANAILAAMQTATGPGQPLGEPFVPGRPMGFLPPAGTDPQADVPAWVARADAGEPYTDDYIRGVIDMLERYHSGYGIDSSHAPPPLFVGTGFTDDLFPVDETLRFVHRMHRDHPGVPVSVLLGDFGHQRAANKKADRERLLDDIRAWMDHYLMQKGPAPPQGFTATTQTCPRDAPSEGPFSAPTFGALARGSVRHASAVEQTLQPGGGDPDTGRAIDPVAGGGDGCVRTSAADAPGTAVYRLPAATGDGYTLLGAPRVIARLKLSGEPSSAQVAARLWDVAPDGATQSLVARASYRPSGAAQDTWEMHANGWRFAAGHVPKLELLAADVPYGRPSNGQPEIAVQRLELRLPVRERLDDAPVRRCVSRRRFSVRVPSGTRVVRMGTRRLRVRHGRVTVDLRGRPRRTVRLRMSVRGGRTVVRTYHPCTPRRASAKTAATSGSMK